MALALGTNVGFVTTAPTADPAGTGVVSDGSSFVVKDTAPAGAVKITEVGWYKSAGTTSSNTQVGLYADSAGVAGTRLQVTGDQASGTSANVWIRFTGLNWPVTAGTAYWLGMQQDAHTGSSNIDSAASGGSGIDTRTSQTALTDPYGGGAVSDADGMYSIYAVYQVAPTVALSSPADSATGVSTTPDLVFTGTDTNGDDVRYEVQVTKNKVTDNFNRADNTDLGANWSNGSTGLEPQIVSNVVKQNNTGNDNISYYSGVSFANDQYAQVTLKAVGDFTGVVVRANGSDEVRWRTGSGSTDLKIIWYNGGAFTQIGSTYTYTPSVNDVLRLEARGTSFYAYINEVLVASGSNGSAPSSGSPGIQIASTSAQIDDFEGGDIVIDAVSGTDAGFANSSGTQLIDSYSEANADDNGNLGGSVSFTGVGQSFDSGVGGTLNTCKFYLDKVLSPTGNAVAKIYAHTGTYGTSSNVTGAALATSDNVDVSTLPASGSPGLITFTFSGANKITLSASTKYVVTVEYSGGDASNYVQVYADVSSSSHAGNAVLNTGSWGADNTLDVNFYVYINDVDPFNSGQAITYTVQSALSNSTTYYWRVRGIDPSGSNTYGAWATTRSFTTAAAGGGSPVIATAFMTTNTRFWGT